MTPIVSDFIIITTLTRKIEFFLSPETYSISTFGSEIALRQQIQIEYKLISRHERFARSSFSLPNRRAYLIGCRAAHLPIIDIIFLNLSCVSECEGERVCEEQEKHMLCDVCYVHSYSRQSCVCLLRWALFSGEYMRRNDYRMRVAFIAQMSNCIELISVGHKTCAFDVCQLRKWCDAIHREKKTKTKHTYVRTRHCYELLRDIYIFRSRSIVAFGSHSHTSTHSTRWMLRQSVHVRRLLHTSTEFHHKYNEMVNIVTMQIVERAPSISFVIIITEL